MHVVQAEHYLADDVCGLALGEAVEFGQSVEQLTALDNLRNDVVIVIIFNEVHNPNDIGMRFFTENLQLILQQFNIDVLLLNRGLMHDLDGEGLLTVLVHAQLDGSEGALAQGFAEEVPIINILQLFELFEITHVQRFLAILRLPIKSTFLARGVRIIPISTAISIHLLMI